MIRALATRGSSCADIAQGSRRFCRDAFAIVSTVRGVERVCRDRQSMPQVIEQLDERSLCVVRFEHHAQFRWRIDECGVIGAARSSSDTIFRTDEAQLLQIGIGKAPSTPLVCPDAVSKHARQALLRVDLSNTLALGVEHPLLSTLAIGCRETQLPCTRLPNSSSLSPADPPRTAARIAPRRSATKRKSLKWPACSAASWRLSVKPSSLRLCGGNERRAYSSSGRR